MIIGVTGHRPEKIDGDYTLRSPVWDAIHYWFSQRLGEDRPDGLVSGMALGVDQVAAECAINVGVPLTAAVPFEGQQARWPAEARNKYAVLLSHAERIVVVSPGGYASWKLHARNQWIVDHSDRLYAVWDGQSGGSASCVRYAQSHNKTVHRLDPKTVIQPTLL